VEKLGEARDRSSKSIIKEPFKNFKENLMIMQITELISNLLKKIEKE